MPAPLMRILPLLLIPLTTWSASVGPATVVVQGLNTAVTITDRIVTYANDYEDSLIDVGVKSYQYTSWVHYPIPNLNYHHEWYAFQDQAGSFHYSYVFFANGVVIFQSGTPYELAGQGLPLTKREWSCTIPNQAFGASHSSLIFRARHRVTKPSVYAFNMTGYYTVDLRFRGIQFGSTCSAPDSTEEKGGAQTFTLARNGMKDVTYGKTNLSIDDLAAFATR